LYKTAFVHKSYIKANIIPDMLQVINNDTSLKVHPPDTSYERLEFIGDSVLDTICAGYIFQRYPDQDEGFLTTLKTKLVSTAPLARLASKLKLNKYIIMSLYTEKKCNGRNNSKILEDVFEAFIGAMFLDYDNMYHNGYVTCRKFLINIFESFIDFADLIYHENNYKKMLLEYYQPTFKTEPQYQTVCISGQTNRIYTMGALHPSGEIIGIGRALKKVDAEQKASKNALKKLGVLPNIDSDSDSDDVSSDESSETELDE
jgi:ribonuclease-3